MLMDGLSGSTNICTETLFGCVRFPDPPLGWVPFFHNPIEVFSSDLKGLRVS
jgi:hypothetical protein